MERLFYRCSLGKLQTLPYTCSVYTCVGGWSNETVIIFIEKYYGLALRGWAMVEVVSKTGQFKYF